jgi:antitoxin component YwqK of YwqJK toxin-antitoxin module
MAYKYLIVLILFIPSFALSQKGSKPKHAPRKEKHRNASDAKGKQGTWKFYTKNRELFLEITYENDVKNGPCVRYHTTTGGVKEEITYYYGEKEGDFKSYFLSGTTRSEGTFKKNRRDGHWIFYYSSTGEKKFEGEYSNGRKEGEWLYYNRNGEMICKGNYKNDNRDGIWHYYDNEGKELKNESYSMTGTANKSTASNDSKNKKPIVISKKSVKNNILPYTKPGTTNNTQKKSGTIQPPVIKNITKPIINFTPTEQEVKRKQDSIKNASKVKINITPPKLNEDTNRKGNK